MSAPRVPLFVRIFAILTIPLWAIWFASFRTPSSVEQALKTSFVRCPEEGQASCFPIGSRFGMTAWLTAAHVVDAAPEAIRFDGRELRILKTERHPSRDVGLLWTDLVDVEALPLADEDAPAGAEAVHAGFPAGRGLWVSQGLLGSVDSDGDTLTSVPMFYGCSGGPVIVDGELVGICTSIYVAGFYAVPTISFIAPVSSFRDWLAESLAHDQSPR